MNDEEIEKVSSTVQDVKSERLDESVKVRWHRKGKIRSEVDDSPTNPSRNQREGLGATLTLRSCPMDQRKSEYRAL